MPKNQEFNHSKSYTFVGIQLLLFLAFVLPIHSWIFKLPVYLRYLFGGISLIGVLLALIALISLNKHLSPWPHPKSDSQLIRQGPYAYIRHPIYTSILLTTFGWSLYAGNGIKLLIALSLAILFYFKARYEESLLTQKFEDYAAYKAESGMFLPFL